MRIKLFFVFSVLQALSYFLSPLFSFFSFIPLFYELRYWKGWKSGLISFTYFFIFNFIYTSWLAKIQFADGISTWIINGLLMTIVIVLAQRISIWSKRKQLVPIFFILLWVCFELLHHYWVFGWPWLTLGNHFATLPKLIQWYQWTGVEGGSLWILFANYFLFKIFFEQHFNVISIKRCLFFLVFPISISLFLFYKKTPSKQHNLPTVRIAVTQPFANTITNKVNELLVLQHIFDSLAQIRVKGSVILLLPETFIKERIYNRRLQDCFSIKKITNAIQSDTTLSCITGLILTQSNSTSANQTVTDAEVYDGAVYLKHQVFPQYHLKTRLIPVEEYLPFFMKTWGFKSDDFSMGISTANFELGNSIKLTPSICYEAIFGQPIAEMVANGGNAIIMLANEQMLTGKEERNYYTNLARIRAIENDRYFVKCSNIGFSGVFDPRGEKVLELIDNKFGVQIFDLPLRNSLTFYSRFYCQIELTIVLFSFGFILFHLINRKGQKGKFV